MAISIPKQASPIDFGERKAIYEEAKRCLATPDLILLILVAEGAKPAAEINIANNNALMLSQWRGNDAMDGSIGRLKEENINELRNILQQLDLNFKLIDDKPSYIIDESNKSYEKLENKHRFAITKKENDLNELVDILEIGGCKTDLAERLGNLLGFPKCCSRVFTWEEDASWKRFHDNMHNSDNECASEKRTYLFHVPCKSDCKESIELSQYYKETLIRTMPDVVRQYEPEIFDFNQNLFRIAYCMKLRRDN